MFPTGLIIQPVPEEVSEKFRKNGRVNFFSCGMLMKKFYKPFKLKIMKKRIVLVAVLSAALFFGCEEDQTKGPKFLTEEEQAVIMEDAASDNVIEAMDYEVDYYTSSREIISGINGTKKSSQWRRWRYKDGTGPAVTVDPTGWSYPKTITVDYADGIELVNGRIISGKIIIDVSDRPLKDGATREITYESFYVDSVHIEGGVTRTFAGSDSTERVFSSESNLTLTFPDSTVLYRTSERTRTLVDGFETLFRHSDDLIMIEGFVNYETSNDITFSKTIVNPITKTGACRFIIEGTVSFSRNGEEFAQLDYGDGTCDDVATITKDGETRQITIGRRLWRMWRR
jgi:hypothetical protein